MTTDSRIPAVCDVVVIGGGPAGSAAAALLAAEGVDVVVLESSEFPRNQVGESLIPHVWKYMDQVGVSEKILAEGFIAKAGGITAWDGKLRQIRFSDFGYERPGMHVERDRFDQLLVEHAAERGARIFNRVSVRNADLADPQKARVEYLDRRGSSPQRGRLQSAFVIDASGHRALLARQLGYYRAVSSSLEFLSIWGYFTDSLYLGEDRRSHPATDIRRVRPVTFVMSYQDGWVWHIVLRNHTSVGLVINNRGVRGMDRDARERLFSERCRSLPYLRELLAGASLIEGSIRTRPDYSYYTSRHCGDNFYCIGDAAGFVDPVFSHGVQNAFYNAAVVCVAIRAALNNRRLRARYSQLCENRIRQFYGFSRALSLGDMGCNGVDRDQVSALIRAMSPLELELARDASEMTNRSGFFRSIAEEAGVWNSLTERSPRTDSGLIDSIQL